MSKRKQLNQLLNEERIAKATVEQLCNDWEWTFSDKEATIVTNEIVINKGKIVEVPVVKEVVKYETKEVVVDNTDTATEEMLRETIRNMNQTINDMIKEQDELKEENNKLYKLYLEEQREKEIWADAHAELKEQYEILEEELIKAEEQNMFLEGQVFGYEQDIKRLKAKANRPVIIMEDEKFEDEEPEEKPVVEETKEEVKPAANCHKNVNITLHDVHKTHDAVKGRTDNYQFVWSIGKNLPAYAPIGATRKEDWKPMGGKMYPDALYIMNTLSNFMEQVKKQKETKAKKAVPNKPQAKAPVADEQEVVLEQPKTNGINRETLGQTVTMKAEDVFNNTTGGIDPMAGADELDL